MDPVLDLVIRATLGLLFAVAVSHKLRDPRRFTATLAEYRLLPGRLAPIAATGVVGGELGVVVALAARPARGLVAAAALLALYAAAVSINLIRGRRDIDCGCSGPAARRPIGPWLVVRNLLTAAVALAAAHASVMPRPLIWIDAFTVVAATATLAACWAAADRLAALGPGLARLREAV